VAKCAYVKVGWFSERVTPRVLTVLDIGITELEMLTDETGSNDAERCLVENQMASDFSGLSARPSKTNQWCN